MRTPSAVLLLLALTPIAAAGPCGDCTEETFDLAAGLNEEAFDYGGDLDASFFNATRIANDAAFELATCGADEDCVTEATNAALVAELQETNMAYVRSMTFTNDVLVLTFEYANELLV